MLSEASQRKDRCLIPPKTLKAAAAQKVATKLLKAGLVREIKAKTGMEAWRRNEETGQAYSLKLTDALAEAAMEGRLPRGFCIKRLTDLPMLWSEQWRAIGLQAPAQVRAEFR